MSACLELDVQSTAAAVEEALSLLVALLTKFNSRSALNRVILALDEAVRNAYEHGNLAISSEEKAKLAAEGGLEEELRVREKIALEKDLRIRISAQVQDGLFSCSISDDGQGFDWRAKLKELDSSKPDPTVSSGRGVSLIQEFFEEVNYNELGNTLRVQQKIVEK